MSETPSQPRRPVAVLGLPLDSLRVAEAVEAIESLILSGGAHQVARVNLSLWREALADPHLHRILAGCTLATADGMPLVWASGLMGCPLAERVTGVDLLPLLAAMSAKKGYPIFLLGCDLDLMRRAARKLERDFPGLRIADIYAPGPRSLARADSDEILRRIHAVRPRILLAAFDDAEPERWLWMHRMRLGPMVAIGVGDALQALTGDLPRGPHWLRRLGFEWLVRCLRHPVRMAPRYARDLFCLARRLPSALLAAWLQPPCLHGAVAVSADPSGVQRIVLAGGLSLALAGPFEAAISRAIAAGKVVVVDVSALHRVSAAGMGLLLDARRRMLAAGLTLSLAGLGLRWRLLFAAWLLPPLFSECRPLASSRPPLE